MKMQFTANQIEQSGAPGRSGQRAKDLTPLGEPVVRNRIADSEVRVALREHIARDDQDVVLDRTCDKIRRGRALGGLRKDVKRPLRLDHLELAAELFKR